MRLLVLGGSWFVGRVVVDDAVGRGHEVMVFNRGRSLARFPDGVRRIFGDRESPQDLRRLASHGPWDVVVDVAGSVPAVVRRSVEALADVAGRWVFVSTISAYRDWPHAPVDETSPLWDGDPDVDPGIRRWDPDAYGPLKVGCELACRQAFGDERLLVLRPHVVLGRHEYVGRLPWWLSRMSRGGQVLAPGPDRAIQPVDVRDLAAFLLNQVERASNGVFNVAPRSEAASYGDMLNACAQATADQRRTPLELVWADEGWLVDQGVRQWTELPLWRHAAAPWGMNVDRAHAAGLKCRPLADTVADTSKWLRTGGRPVDHERFSEHGIAPDKEAALIRRWLDRTPPPASASSRTHG
ncbi:NAD-dependent epimerase/dehydratase family protein [Rhizomonospora bruguierae]|uniref:NAD-dependent epimerase/dehydratase family protein n=1 Tax=Rhizomonospora bruguierae TaxID=1581705 RepID=UPI001BCDE998|nr:NAD-dependent epimerase/dehydratase family protein [Micromonospora sp. NBRC 107566]